MHPLAVSAQQYIADTLGVPVSRRAAHGVAEKLPYFLKDTFELVEWMLAGQVVLLALDERRQAQLSVRDIRTRVEKLRTLAKCPVLYVVDSLASYERKRLIEARVPFVVPGNQLYLPDLGIDLREYFRSRAPVEGKPLSPASQAMLIVALLRPQWEADWHPAETAAALGYTPMTLSRAVRELAAAGLAQVRPKGRSQHLVMTYSAAETWARARPLLRSPVQRTVWAEKPPPRKAAARLAGVSALAQHSMLNPPSIPVYAISAAEWKGMKAQVQCLPEPAPDGCEWQIWAYSTSLSVNGETVDPLSLMLSVEADPDERVQQAVKALEEQLPW